MSSAAANPPIRPARPVTNKWLVTISVTFGTLMGTIDASIVNVAMPQIRGEVGATIQEITWISTGFAIATVLVMPLTAFLGRFFGQKRVYMTCLAVFIGGSALCGLAGSLGALIAFRVLQGFGAGALMPTEQAILRQTFPPEEQGMAMALFGVAVTIGPAIGPTLGGYIVDHYHWSWIFFINLPVGMLGLFMVWRFVHEPEDLRAASHAAAEAQRKNLDWQGIALLCAGLAALQYLLEEGQRDDWFQSRTITACAVVAVVGLLAFVYRELTAPVPAVNIRLFRDPVFSSGTLIGAVMFAILMAGMFLLPLFMQEMLGFTATQSGVALVPRVAVMMVLTPVVGKLYNHISPRIFIAFGVLMIALGCWYQGMMTLQTSNAGIIQAVMIQGVGFSCLFVPLTAAALSNVPRALVADATGLNSLLRQIGGSIGLAAFATLLSRYAVEARASIAAHVIAERPEVISRLSAMQSAMVARGLDPVTARTASLGALSRLVMQQAMVMSFEKVFLLAGVLLTMALPLLLFLKVNRAGPEKVHIEAIAE
jgi:DHA2 family multidrug resistance protein